ncbi:hypothetical protein BJ878DRAFT_303662 [Calycina marina]|uniref:Uncharacterized protein n=1 Tax=Calycina marina TaxID=1763456 RepID=A0A9P8CGZ2_9HELO|nr:hypothetical protein BJ878DRAFT_303662 [Calycina marina]
MMEFNIFAMPPSSILLLLSAAFRITNALPWAGPEPTIVYQADEWSPVPTQIRVDPKELFRRTNVDVAVCGWLGGDKDNPAVCPTGSSCIHDWAHGYVGCCATVGSCTAGVYTSCVDKNSLGGTTGPVVVNNGVFTCPSDSLCYKNTYPGNYFQWACGSTDQATAVETSYDGQPTDLLLQVVYTRMAFSPITLPSTTSSSPSSTAIPAITSNTGSASTTRYPNANAAGASAGSSSTTSPVEDNSGKKINGGIVAAGVVATGAFIIVLVGIVFFFLRRRKNQQEQGSPSAGGGGGGPFRRAAKYHTVQLARKRHFPVLLLTRRMTSGLMRPRIQLRHR